MTLMRTLQLIEALKSRSCDSTPQFVIGSHILSLLSNIGGAQVVNDLEALQLRTRHKSHCNSMRKYKALQTHNLLLAKDNDENDFESHLNTLQEKDEAGQKLARHHLETCERQRIHCQAQILDFCTGFLVRSAQALWHYKMFFSPSHT